MLIGDRHVLAGRHRYKEETWPDFPVKCATPHGKGKELTTGDVLLNDRRGWRGRWPEDGQFVRTIRLESAFILPVCKCTLKASGKNMIACEQKIV